MPKMNKKKCGSESNITLFKCQICASVFPSMTELSAHSVSHQDDAVFRCIKCNICFLDLSLLNNHSVRAHRPSMHICPQCDEKFLRGWLLEDHMNIHLGEAPYSCSVCALTFAERKTMSVHNCMSHGNEENICSDCGSTYKNVGDLRKHIFTYHSKSRPFWCDKCGDDFICTIDREQHLFKIHSAFHADVCTICFLQFSGAEEVKTHQESAHAVKQINCDDKKLDCPDKRSECADKPFDGKQREDKKYKCSLCKYSFRCKYNLKMHTLQRHTEHKPFECGQCRKCFASEKILNIHILTHTTIGTFKCSNIGCNRVFSKRGSLTRHEKNHCSGNPNKSGSSEANRLIEYPCLYCKERFKTFSEAQTHIKSHGELKLQPVQMKSEINMTNGDLTLSHSDKGYNLAPSDTEIQPYSCLQCRQCFSADSEFYAHMKTHIIEPMDCFESVSEKNSMDCKKEPKQFPCLQCNECYSTPFDLEAHKIVHSDSESLKGFDGNVHLIKYDNDMDCNKTTKPFPCLACHKCFTLNSDLEIHMKTHIQVNN